MPFFVDSGHTFASDATSGSLACGACSGGGGCEGEGLLLLLLFLFLFLCLLFFWPHGWCCRLMLSCEEGSVVLLLLLGLHEPLLVCACAVRTNHVVCILLWTRAGSRQEHGGLQDKWLPGLDHDAAVAEVQSCVFSVCDSSMNHAVSLQRSCLKFLLLVLLLLVLLLLVLSLLPVAVNIFFLIHVSCWLWLLLLLLLLLLFMVMLLWLLFGVGQVGADAGVDAAFCALLLVLVLKVFAQVLDELHCLCVCSNPALLAHGL